MTIPGSKSIRADFYVYRWVRLDTGMPFYIGKGRGRRYLNTSRRSAWFKSILRKTRCKVEMILSGVTDTEAIAKEMWFIGFYRKCGLDLCNMTDGGDGACGRKCSEQTRKKMSEAQSGKKNAMFGKKTSDETKSKLSVALSGSNNPMFGKKGRMSGKSHSAEALAKMLAAHTGKKRTLEARAKMSAAAKARWAKRPAPTSESP